MRVHHGAAKRHQTRAPYPGVAGVEARGGTSHTNMDRSAYATTAREPPLARPTTVAEGYIAPAGEVTGTVKGVVASGVLPKLRDGDLHSTSGECVANGSGSDCWKVSDSEANSRTTPSVQPTHSVGPSTATDVQCPPACTCTKLSTTARRLSSAHSLPHAVTANVLSAATPRPHTPAVNTGDVDGKDSSRLADLDVSNEGCWRRHMQSATYTSEDLHCTGRSIRMSIPCDLLEQQQRWLRSPRLL
jgi:hypothetical protein